MLEVFGLDPQPLLTFSIPIQPNIGLICLDDYTKKLNFQEYGLTWTNWPISVTEPAIHHQDLTFTTILRIFLISLEAIKLKATLFPSTQPITAILLKLMSMHTMGSFKHTQLTNSWRLKIWSHLSLLEVPLLDQASMDSIGQEIIMQAGNIYEDQLLTISIIKCLASKWLALIFVALEVTLILNFAQDGSNWDHFIHLQGIIMTMIQFHNSRML